MMHIRRSQTLVFAVFVLVILLVLSGLRPFDRTTWMLEVFPVVIALPVLWATYHRFPLTNLLYFFIFLHALVLMLGGAYSYARVPLGFYLADWLDLSRNPYDKIGHFFQGLVPALVDDGRVLIQSPAIIEWLEERHPNPPLLPRDPEARARVRALAAIVGCDIHPINNRRILEYLRKTLGCDEAAVNAWCATWIDSGFAALESLLAADKGRGGFCYGGAPTLADVYLVPQVESARRFKVDLAPYPNIVAIDAACGKLDAFRRAAPAVQPDAPKT